ncbi:MAG: type II secretion system minor pseudopilin GspK [Granulosicoccus sp.]
MHRLTIHNRKQRGVAIITAMLVIALGTITMVSISSSQNLDMQRERNEAIMQQARAFGISGERFATAVLYRDHKDGLRGGSDSLEDDWAQTLPPVPIDQASIQGCIVDMQGRFNLNNLVDASGVAAPVYVDQLKRLLQRLNIDGLKADAIVDWIDQDFNPITPEGAEDDYYTGLEVGYRAANTYLTSISELQLIKGFSSAIEEEREDYELLLPHVAVLPAPDPPASGAPAPGDATAINVNSATPDVLASLSNKTIPLADELSRWETLNYEEYPECEELFDLSDTSEAVPTGPSPEPFEEKNAFEQAWLAEIANTGVSADEQKIDINVNYGVRSNYFQVRIDVEAEGITLTQYTLLKRDAEGRSKVIYRSRDTL